MDILVQRRWATSNSTCGEMQIDGERFCFTLEPRADQSKGKPYAIPAGTYKVSFRHSPRLGYMTPYIHDVPGFEDILIHVGNYPKDTHGCTLVGETHMTDFVGNSKKTFNQLMVKLIEPITITYRDPDNSIS